MYGGRVLPLAPWVPDSPERIELFHRMTRRLGEQCAWIYEGFPVSYQLCHAWLENYHPHDFPYNRWKFLAVKTQVRDRLKASFTPLELSELSGGRP